MLRGSHLLRAVALAFVGCAPTAGPSGPLEPLMVGTEQYMSVEWQTAVRDQVPIVWGYVNNYSPYTFDRLRLLIDALTPDGAILEQRLVWAPGLLGGGSRSYFEAPMAPAPVYRVRVFSYDRVESDGLRRRFPF